MTSSTMTSKGYRNNKKIDEVKEVIQNKPDADIVKILELFDNDVAKTINAFMTDGGKDALSKWSLNKKQEKKSAVKTQNEETNVSETNVTNGKKSPKKSNKKAENNSNGPRNNQAANNNINDLVSSIINQSINTTVPSDTQPVKSNTSENSQDTSLKVQVQQQQNILNSLNNLIISSQPLNSSKAIGGLNVTVLGIEQPTKQTTNQSSLNSSPSSISAASTSSSIFENKQGTQVKQNKISQGSQMFNESSQKANLQFHPLNNHLNLSYRNPNNTKNVLDKASKDLQRQSTVLSKISTQFQEELNKSQISFNQTFLYLHQLLDQRQNQLQANLNTLARNASQALSQRQHKASQLKNLADNVVHLNDQDTLELKADIKHFVSERLLDEEFGKIKTFQEENYEQLHDAIKSYGRVGQISHIKYASKRPPLDEVLNNSFTAPVAPQPIPEQKNNSKKLNSASNKQINGSAKPSNDVKSNGKFNIKITDVNGLSDENNDDEGEFIEVKKNQRNKNKQQNQALTNGVQANGGVSSANDVESNKPKKQSAQTNGKTVHAQYGQVNNTNGNQTNGGSKKQKKQKKSVVDVPIPKANINPFSLIANGHIN